MSEQPPSEDPSQVNPVPPGYQPVTTDYPDLDSCYQDLEAVENDESNPGAQGICQYNPATGKYDLYVNAPADPGFADNPLDSIYPKVDPGNPDSVGEIGESSQVGPGFPDRTLPGEVPVPDLSDEDAWGSVSTPPENPQN